MDKTFKLRGRSQGELHTVVFVVDKTDAHIVRAHSWTLWKRPGGYGIKRKFGKESITLAHDILGVPTGTIVRHADNNSLNFRRVNLVVDELPLKGSSEHCRAGHDLSVVGAYPSGLCRECNRIACRKYKSKIREETRA